VVTNAPYSADVITETTQALPDGNHIHQTSTSKFYRDSQGRTRREQSLDAIRTLAPDAKLPPAVFIDDPVSGANYALNTTNKTATKAVFRRAGRAAAAGPADRLPAPAPIRLCPGGGLAAV
jgi:hypothetical protein